MGQFIARPRFIGKAFRALSRVRQKDDRDGCLERPVLRLRIPGF